MGRLEDVRLDGILAVAVLFILGGSSLAGASFFATDGPPWPLGVIGVVVAVAAASVAVQRVREVIQ